jgi:hypothetical protein
MTVPPQPYLPTFASKRYSVGFEALSERPAFAEKIGRCMGIWSYVDNELGSLFGILIGQTQRQPTGCFWYCADGHINKRLLMLRPKDIWRAMR